MSSIARNPLKLQIVRALFWTHFISAVLIPFYRDWGGLGFTAILLVNAWFMVWNFLLEVPTGTVADVWGRKVSIVAGCFVGVVAALVYTSAPHVAVFLLAEIVFATSFTLLSGADEALLYDSLEEAGETSRAQREYGRLAAAQQIGIVTGALLGSVIATRLGVRAPLALQTIPMALAGLVALSLVEPASHRDRKSPTYREVLTVGVRTFLGHGVLKVLAADMIVHGALAWMIIWFYQPLLERAGIGLLWFGAVHVLMSLGQIVVLSQVDALERLVGSRRALLWIGPLVTGAGFLILAGDLRAALVVPTIALVAAFGLSRPPLFSAELNRHLERGHRATVLSTVTMLRTAAIAIVNPIAGWMADRSLTVALVVLGIVSLAYAVASPLRSRHLGASAAVPARHTR
jgi:MFS family permease